MSEQQSLEWYKVQWLQSLHREYEREKAKAMKEAKWRRQRGILLLFILLILLPIVIAWIAAINF